MYKGNQIYLLELIRYCIIQVGKVCLCYVLEVMEKYFRFYKYLVLYYIVGCVWLINKDDFIGVINLVQDKVDFFVNFCVLQLVK